MYPVGGILGPEWSDLAAIWSDLMSESYSEALTVVPDSILPPMTASYTCFGVIVVVQRIGGWVR